MPHGVWLRLGGRWYLCALLRDCCPTLLRSDIYHTLETKIGFLARPGEDSLIRRTAHSGRPIYSMAYIISRTVDEEDADLFSEKLILPF
jgi:hypothetical protein